MRGPCYVTVGITNYLARQQQSTSSLAPYFTQARLAAATTTAAAAVVAAVVVGMCASWSLQQYEEYLSG